MQPSPAPDPRPPLLRVLRSAPRQLALYALLAVCWLLYFLYCYVLLPALLLGLFLAFGERRPGKPHPADALTAILKTL